jgi:DNA-binding Lrp family transcriptional regulator
LEFQKISGDYKKDIRLLSTIDKEILKILLNPNNGKRSSEILSRRTGSPVSTIQRRRKQLEKEYLELSYTLLIEKFGWRRVDLLISTTSGKTDTIAEQLLTREEVVSILGFILQKRYSLISFFHCTDLNMYYGYYGYPDGYNITKCLFHDLKSSTLIVSISIQILVPV